MALGSRIRARRTELGWTQDELAQKAGISKGFLSDLENGKRGVGADTLLDLARVLSASLDFLMTGNSAVQQEIQKEIEIPATLGEFANSAGLSFRQTLTLLDMQRQIIAHRSSSRKENAAGFDWAKFYESVRGFL